MTADICIDNVVCITHDSKSVRIVMFDGTLLDSNVTYYHIIRLISDQFVRVNKNTIVNLSYAIKIDDDFIYMAKKNKFDKENKFNIDSEYLKNATNEFYKFKLKKFLPN